MQLIEKIVIHRFRSISDSTINVSQLNIFSGKNNSGKSNVLRALNLFFNGESSFNQKYSFEADYNQAYTGHAGGKRETIIELHFGKQGDAALSAPFSIKRIFQAGLEVQTSYHSTDESVEEKIRNGDGNTNRQFTIFLNKIKYFYIPAVRDKKFVQSLFLLFEQLIEHDSGRDFSEKMDGLSDILKTKSEEISADFEKFIGLPTRATLSSKISDLLGTVEINVKTGIEIVSRTQKEGKKKKNVEVNLFSSGDGILMSYLAYFLAHICKKISNKVFIWGFEEPENSLEYSKIQILAKEFYISFLKNAQIFVTTHSPAFINLKDKNNVSFYRVYIEPTDSKQSSKIRTINEIKSRQLFLFESGDMEKEEYQKLSEELHFVEQSQEIEKIVESVNAEKAALVESRNKLEDKYNSILRTHPIHVFICEDSSKNVVELWEKWLKAVGVKNIIVMSSSGCSTTPIETWAIQQMKLDRNYKPKIFREIDRDGLNDEQINELKTYLNQQFSHQIKYQIEFLPVNEIENFAVINNPIFNEIFWNNHRDDILKSFELTASERAKSLDKFFGYQSSSFRVAGGNPTAIMQEMRDEAYKDWKKFFNGKEMCKKIPNYNPTEYLNSLAVDQLPNELNTFLINVKAFYET